MKKLISILLFIGHCTFVAQTNSPTVSIIPKPNKIEPGKGNFSFTSETKIVIGNPSRFGEVETFLMYCGKFFEYRLHVIPDPQPDGNAIVLKTVKWDKDAPEKYELNIEKEQITISAQENGSGFAYGLQSILQLLSATQGSVNTPQTPTITLACMKITDEPRYAWRGMHLDVSRHFFDVPFIKKYIDLIAFYKLNTFHWHLTDDQGWRIEIKSYPKLILDGAWRKASMVGPYSDNKYDSLHYGGYYSQESIREIVSYATKKHVTVVPEIEMPGHSVAAISAYQQLSCTHKQIDVAKGWGVFNDVLCPRDSTFTFIEGVLTEVMDLFPSKYIHIGGDECPKDSWKACKRCQALMKKENLKDENELQSYFIRRVEKFVNSNGRQIIGWDEILQGGLAPNAAVMSWQGIEGGIAAAKQKHQVVMSPGKPLYFDHYQSAETDKEPLAIGGYNPLDSVYAYNPTPPGLSKEEQKYILGAQANLWTEYISNDRQAEYMLLPRLLALSEVLWTQPANKNYSDFLIRLQQNQKWFDFIHLNYAKHYLKK